MSRQLDVINVDGEDGGVFRLGRVIRRRDVGKSSLATGVVEVTQDLASVVRVEGRRHVGDDSEEKDLA